MYWEPEVIDPVSDDAKAYDLFESEAEAKAKAQAQDDANAEDNAAFTIPDAFLQ